MKTYALCPISDKKINERVARINAVFTVLLLLTFLITQNILAILFLVVDFLLRSTGHSKVSLLAISSQNIVRWLSVKEYFINAGPKIFAARIGLVLSSLIIISFFLSFTALSFILAGILGLFSFLEGAFGICVACEIYPYLYKFLYANKFSGT